MTRLSGTLGVYPELNLQRGEVVVALRVNLLVVSELLLPGVPLTTR